MAQIALAAPGEGVLALVHPPFRQLAPGSFREDQDHGPSLAEIVVAGPEFGLLGLLGERGNLGDAPGQLAQDMRVLLGG